VDICVLKTDLPGRQYGMAEEFTEKLIEKEREYVFLYDAGHPEYKNLVKKKKIFSLILYIHHLLLFIITFYNSLLTGEVLQRNWTS
jgi:uncharacterized membrane protein (DUF485 family)